MKLINQSIKITQITNKPMEQIENAARLCYQSAASDQLSQEKLISALLKKQHHAMIEFADITVLITTNRGVSHELVRHRLCSFAQESTRYCDYKKQLEIIRPVWLNIPLGTYNLANMFDKLAHLRTTAEIYQPAIAFLMSCCQAENRYRDLRAYNWKPEQAREVLPTALATRIFIKANVREWRHICALRSSARAHPQIRPLAQQIHLELSERLPILFPKKRSN